MLTWRLWQLLRKPPLHHPVFRREMNAPAFTRRLRKRLSLLPELLMAVAFITLFALGVFTLVQGYIFVAVVAALVIFGGTLYGLDWSVAVSDANGRERESGTFSLLSMIPQGAFGAAWYIALGQVYRDASFYRRYERFSRVMLLLIALIIFLIAGIYGPGRTEFWSEYTVGVGSMIAFTVAAYVDFIQSVLIGVLLGILASTATTRRTDAQLWAIIGFLGVQVGTYLLIYLVGFFMLPTIGHTLHLDAVTLELVLLVPRLLVFVLVREVAVSLLWQRLLLRFNERALVLS